MSTENTAKKAVEDTIDPDNVRQLVTDEVGLQGRLHVDEQQRDAGAGQIGLQGAQLARRRVVDTGDGAGIDD